MLKIAPRTLEQIALERYRGCKSGSKLIPFKSGETFRKMNDSKRAVFVCGIIYRRGADYGDLLPKNDEIISGRYQIIDTFNYEPRPITTLFPWGKAERLPAYVTNIMNGANVSFEELNASPLLSIATALIESSKCFHYDINRARNIRLSALRMWADHFCVKSYPILSAPTYSLDDVRLLRFEGEKIVYSDRSFITTGGTASFDTDHASHMCKDIS